MEMKKYEESLENKRKKYKEEFQSFKQRELIVKEQLDDYRNMLIEQEKQLNIEKKNYDSSKQNEIRTLEEKKQQLFLQKKEIEKHISEQQEELKKKLITLKEMSSKISNQEKQLKQTIHQVTIEKENDSFMKNYQNQLLEDARRNKKEKDKVAENRKYLEQLNLKTAEMQSVLEEDNQKFEEYKSRTQHQLLQEKRKINEAIISVEAAKKKIRRTKNAGCRTGRRTGKEEG